jgi:transcriptional regulator with XRE-family HTH domain
VDVAELGSWLIRAREARGLTLEDAERDTRISRRYLQALEEERFEVIPAPVYARGFLRSYSQYLGLDPQEAMARYPRDDDAYITPVTQPREARRQQREQRPAVGAENRPTWRRPTPIRGTSGGVVPAPMPPTGYEPTIGIDIGVPVPTRRLDRDQSAPTKTAAVVVVAIAAVLFVILLAFLLSSLGGEGDGGGIDVPDDGATATGDDDDAAAEPTATSSTLVQPGVVPSVEGLPREQAVAEVIAAGFEPVVREAPSSAEVGIVVSQSPAGEFEHEPGGVVTLLVSSGPE